MLIVAWEALASPTSIFGVKMRISSIEIGGQMVTSCHDWDMISAKITEVFRCVCIGEYLMLIFRKAWRMEKWHMECIVRILHGTSRDDMVAALYVLKR